jgi:putative transcriptional regulator
MPAAAGRACITVSRPVLGGMLSFERLRMTSLQGQLLIASPHLNDGNFFRSVVLMVKHDDDGALGLILNQATSKTVRELWQMVADEDVDCDQPLYLGGPVSGPLVCLHQRKSCAEAEIIAGVYFAAHKDMLRKIVTQPSKQFRLYTGYSGWGAGQLEEEMRAGGWLTLPASYDLVFSSPDELWDEVVQCIGRETLSVAARSKHVPSDPSLN